MAYKTVLSDRIFCNNRNVLYTVQFSSQQAYVVSTLNVTSVTEE